MNAYVNGFKAAVKHDKSEYILVLVQETPTFDDKGVVLETVTETVGSFTLSQRCAKALAKDLYDTFLNSSDEDVKSE